MSPLARAVAAALLSALMLTGFATPAHATDLDNRIASAARRLEVVVEQYNGSREDLAATQQRSRALGSSLTPLVRELDRRQELMNDVMAQTYRRTRTGPTVALFASDHPHEFVNKLLVLHEIAAAERRAATDLNATRTKITATRAALDTLAARQRHLQTQLKTRKAIVQGEITTLKKMRTIAYAGGSRYSATGKTSVPEYVPGPAGRVVSFAFGQLGKPYRWGAEGPAAYDCSGLTLAAWRTAGVHLPHNAARQYATMAHVGRDQLHPGDLVFFYSPVSHVGVYIGGGSMIHAPEYGENVRVAGIDSQPVRGFGRPA